MGMNKARIGFILGIIVALLIGTADIPGLARNGQICMALSFMTVIFWGFQITQPGYTSGLYLLLLAVFGVEKPALIFSTWTGPMMFLIVGAYLIAGAVNYRGDFCFDFYPQSFDPASVAACFSDHVGHGCRY